MIDPSYNPDRHDLQGFIEGLRWDARTARELLEGDTASQLDDADRDFLLTLQHQIASVVEAHPEQKWSPIPVVTNAAAFLQFRGVEVWALNELRRLGHRPAAQPDRHRYDPNDERWKFVRIRIRELPAEGHSPMLETLRLEMGQWQTASIDGDERISPGNIHGYLAQLVKAGGAFNRRDSQGYFMDEEAWQVWTANGGSRNLAKAKPAYTKHLECRRRQNTLPPGYRDTDLT
jgi:hypothetical protein